VLDRDPAPPTEWDTAVPSFRPMSTVAKRSPISATAELLFKMASCVWTLDHPRRILGGLYRCVNYGWNQQCSFEDMRVSMLCEFGLKMLIQASVGGGSK